MRTKSLIWGYEISKLYTELDDTASNDMLDQIEDEKKLFEEDAEAHVGKRLEGRVLRRGSVASD